MINRNYCSKVSLSIIMPFYNGDRFVHKIRYLVEECISNSAELIIVDDGSDEDRAKEVYDVVQGNLYCTLLRQENSGPSMARWYGLNSAKGKYVIFLDCDDCISKEYVKVLVDHIENSRLTELAILKEEKTSNISLVPTDGFKSEDVNVSSITLVSRLEFLRSIFYGSGRVKVAPSLLLIRYDFAMSSFVRCDLSWGEDVPWLFSLLLNLESGCAMLPNIKVLRWYGESSRGTSYTHAQIVDLVGEVRNVCSSRIILKKSVPYFVYFRFFLSYLYKRLIV